MSKKHLLLGLLLITFLFTGCVSKSRKIKNLETFARVYGYVRWFYPGDEAAKIDWTQFAVYGVGKIENARSQKQLREELLILFKPIAPAIQIEDSILAPKFEIKSIVPPDTSGLKPVTWVHYGVYLGEKSNIYRSKRTNRQTPNPKQAIPGGRDLTAYRAKIGDYISKDIGSNLVCIMPLVLYGTTDQTYPLPDTISAQKLNYGLQHISNSILNTEHSNGRLANIIITWNVLQHFYPYFDDIKVDWKQELSKSLNNVIQVNTEIDYFKCLSLMISKLEDGHGVVSCININRWGFPVSFVYVENKVVVSGSNSSLFKTGDIIESVDGKSAYDELGLQESYISGSPQLKRYRALNVFGSSFLETPAKIILLRDGKKLSIKADRDTECNLFFNDFNSRNFNSNNKALDCGDSIYYEKSGTYFYTELDKLIEAKGIIVSSYFNVMEIIPHLIKEPLWSPRWRVPITTYPDREKVVFDTSRWKIEPMKPFIKAKVVFIVEPFNVSYGETLLSFIDYYKLGKLVGDTTAGTNGNVNFIPLLGRYSIMWTGMKVLKHDGSQLHLTGYRPDYPVKRTIHGIREGRDEYLDKALEILKK